MKLDRIERRARTIYILCRRCGMDMCWPSWCKCKPRRILSAADIVTIRATGKTGAQDVPELLREGYPSDDTSHDAPGAQGRSQASKTTP